MSPWNEVWFLENTRNSPGIETPHLRRKKVVQDWFVMNCEELNKTVFNIKRKLVWFKAVLILKIIRKPSGEIKLWIVLNYTFILTIRQRGLKLDGEWWRIIEGVFQRFKIPWIPKIDRISRGKTIKNLVKNSWV